MSTTPLLEREPKTIARDSAYVVAGIVDGVYTEVTALPTKARELRETAPERIRSVPASLREVPATIRERAATEVDEQTTRFESAFDARAASGADAVARVREDERVVRVRTALEPVGAQMKTARSQVKGAVTSIRKTVDAATTAGREQAETARSQVKAAATSTRKTVQVAADAGRSLAS